MTVPRGVPMELLHEIEQFLYHEAELLDAQRFEEWLALMADEIHYWMPIRSNKLERGRVVDDIAEDAYAHFDDDKQTLGWRVTQLGTGMHWAEDPPSRTRHLVSNVRARAHDEAGHYAVTSNFLCYRTRGETEVDIWAGERADVLRRLAGDDWRVVRRRILLDQTVVLSKNLSVLF